MAETGVPVSEVFAGTWAAPASLAAVRGDPEATRVFLPEGGPPAAGQVFANPDLARTLRLVAAGGRDVFYAKAEELHRGLQKRKIFLALLSRTSVSATYRSTSAIFGTQGMGDRGASDTRHRNLSNDNDPTDARLVSSALRTALMSTTDTLPESLTSTAVLHIARLGVENPELLSLHQVKKLCASLVVHAKAGA